MVMVIGEDAVCVGLPLSRTAAVKDAVPPESAVPEMTPVVPLSESPAGRLPEAIDQLYPGVPPVAWSEAEYGRPNVPGAGRADVMLSAGAAMLTESETEAVCAGLPLSCTVATKDAGPGADGVPEMTPDALSVRPAGRLPDARDHEYPGVPPETESVCE